MAKGFVGFEERSLQANGLSHRVLAWSPTAPLRDAAPASTVVLVHGLMDAAGSWDRVAPVLAAVGYRVFAPDMRGFGDGGRAPSGSYYHFSDYVADLAALVEVLSPGEPVALVGHSMGGTITTLYAGAFPERVARLASLEGLGPPDNAWEVGPIRMRRWIEGVRALRQKGEPPLLTREEAFQRLAVSHPIVPREILEHRFEHLVHVVTDADGTERVQWRFDPLHRTTAPVPFFAKLFVEFAKRVTCPVLFISGGASGFHVPDEEERLAAFSALERAAFEGAGHMIHWTQPDELAARLVAFL